MLTTPDKLMLSDFWVHLFINSMHIVQFVFNFMLVICLQKTTLKLLLVSTPDLFVPFDFIWSAIVANTLFSRRKLVFRYFYTMDIINT